jgi:glycosyltransferase involved in cell wall biosynthesis
VGKNKKLAIVTCCLDDWGGSEELWAKSTLILKNEGLAHITVFKNRINEQHPEFAKLKQQNIRLKELEPQSPLVKTLLYKLKDIFDHAGEKLGLTKYTWNKPAERFYNQLKSDRPDLVLISQGINFDGLVYAYQCLRLNIRYIIVSHKAVNFYWPSPGDRSYMKETLLKAEKCLFVSEHNRKLTEEQFGIKLVNSNIVINPVKTPVSPLPYPSVANGYRLACVGRLFVIDKGQDILIRILAQPKWKSRDFFVSFIGKGPDHQGLVEMAALLGVENISFSGYNEGLTEIWSNHHALVLPSRSEGLPLTVIEAMSLGRMVIAANAGGNAEIINNEVTGFIAEPNETDFDKAMEIAWNRRSEWESIGLAASRHIAEQIPQSPERQFANLLNDILNER